MLNSKAIAGQAVAGFFISVGTTLSSLVTNQDGAAWGIGMGVANWTETGFSALIAEIPTLVDDFCESIMKL